MWQNRTLCDVLEEMRKCLKSLQLAPLAGLIEEAQSMGNRMEAALNCKRDLQQWHEDWRKYGKRLKELKKQVDAAKQVAGEEPSSSASRPWKA